MKKASLLPRTKSGRLSLILLALLIPAYWDQFQDWRIRKGPHGAAAPVPEIDPARTAGKTTAPHPANPDAEHSGRTDRAIH